MIPSDQRPPGQDYLIRRITDLERLVRELLAGRRLEAAMIGKGGITVSGGAVTIKDDGKLVAQYTNGEAALDVGANTLSDGTAVHGVLIRRPGGEIVLWTFGRDDGGSAFWALYDKSGNIVVSDDAVSGQGLATPYIPLTVVPWSSVTMAGRVASTASTSFAGLYSLNGHKQHPKIRVTLAVMLDPGVAGELRVRNANTGAVVMDPIAYPAGTYTYTDFTFQPVGPHTDWQRLDIEMRVTSGAGAVGLTVVAAYGIQS